MSRIQRKFIYNTPASTVGRSIIFQERVQPGPLYLYQIRIFEKNKLIVHLNLKQLELYSIIDWEESPHYNFKRQFIKTDKGICVKKLENSCWNPLCELSLDPAEIKFLRDKSNEFMIVTNV